MSRLALERLQRRGDQARLGEGIQDGQDHRPRPQAGEHDQVLPEGILDGRRRRGDRDPPAVAAEGPDGVDRYSVEVGVSADASPFLLHVPHQRLAGAAAPTLAPFRAARHELEVLIEEPRHPALGKALPREEAVVPLQIELGDQDMRDFSLPHHGDADVHGLGSRLGIGQHVRDERPPVGDHRAPDIERGGGQLACSERPTVGSERLELRPVGIVPQGILGAGIEVLIWHWAGSPQGGQDGEPLHRAVERVVHRGGEQAHQLDLGAFALVLLCPPVQYRRGPRRTSRSVGC
jgi:hypothetical protein